MAELSTLGAVIKPAYEGQTNTHAFDDAAFNKLAGIQALAKDDPTIQDEGVALTKRSILNFLGAGVTAVDSGSRIDITIPGGGGSGGGSTVALTTGTSAATPYSHAIAASVTDLLSAGVVPATAFGIYPNSGADETARIQNAMLDLQNEGPNPVTGRKRALYFQNGTYLTTGITTTTSTMLVGDGGTVFQFNGTHGANTYVLKVTIPGSGPRVTYGMCRGIKINGLSPANEMAESGIWFATATDWSCLLSEVQIFQCGLYAVRVVGATNLLINDFRVDAVGRSAVMVEQEDTRQNLLVMHQGTVTFNDPGSISRWQTQGYIASGSIGGAVAYWGAAVLELKHTGSAGGGSYVAIRDYAIEWHYEGDPAGNGVVLDWNSSTNINRMHRVLLENVHGFTDSPANGHQMVGFRGTNARQPIVTAHHASLDGSLARAIRDFTQGVNYGTPFTTSFSWAGGGSFFAEGGKTMFGAASVRPAANSWLNGVSYFATDTLALSFHVNGGWVNAAGGGGGGASLAIQDENSSPLSTQPTLSFQGLGVSVAADAANSRNIVTIPGGGGGASLAIQDENSSPLSTQPTLSFQGLGVSVAADTGNSRNIVTIPGSSGSSGPVIQYNGTPILPTRPGLNFTGAGVSSVADDSANNRTVVTIPGGGGGGGSAHVIVDETTSLPARTNLTFVGPNVVATDDALGDRTVVTIAPPPEPAAGGTLVPGAIAITAAGPTPYNSLTQSGALNFALDAANSTFNWGVIVFTLVSDGSAVTWNANLVHGDTGRNSDLATSFPVGPHQIMIAFDEAATQGRVYYSGSADATKLPLAGGTVTGDIKLGTGGSITGLNRNLVSGVIFKDTARGFFDAGNRSGVVTLDYRNGYWQRMTATGNITSLAITNVPQTGNVAEMRLQIHQDASVARTVSFGSPPFYFAGGTPYAISTTLNAIDLIDIATWDGGGSWLSFGTSKNFGLAPYAPNGVVFNGSTYLARNGQFTGAVDAIPFTFAFAVRFTGTQADQHILCINQSSANGFASLIIGRTSGNRIYLYGASGSATSFQMNTNTSLTNGQWYAVVGSIGDLTARNLYLNDALDLAVTSQINVARDFTNTQNTVGTFADPPGTNNLVGELSDLWFQAGLYTDFAVASNRRKFFDASNKLVFKGANGQTPFGTAPTLFLSGSTNTWQNNLGTGGGMTVTGTLSTSATQPLGA
jgi:hypothetical protein